MSDLGVRSGPNCSCADLGPFAGLGRFTYGPPGLPTRHKVFLKDALGLSGAEVSLNVMRPGEEMPFFHRHERNEELYVFIGGRGQVQVDGEVFEVSEGTAVRMSPAAVRAWRNHSADDLYFLVIQYPAGGHVTGATSDGVLVPGRPEWPGEGAERRDEMREARP
jgi:mannose-6-phosphate isomerase-like protein (cupin superfamily)